MKNEPEQIPGAQGSSYQRYPLLDALRQRRSRRFGKGMAIPDGPFTYQSRFQPQPLSEEEEAALAFAGAGITGQALADLSYGPGQGGGMLAGLIGRTIASPDAIHTVSLFLTNDRGTYLIRRPQDFPPGEIGELIRLGEEGSLVEVYQRSRVQISHSRSAPPVQPGFNFNINRWSLYAPGGTYLLPVNELTALYINALLEAFDEEMGYFVLDERANFSPAGLRSFGRSRGGHLDDNPQHGRTLTVQLLETSLMEGCAIEQGMMLQNIGLMAQALGLGGFPNFAPHPFSWFESLGFRTETMPASRFLGVNPIVTKVLGLLGRDSQVARPIGLERDSEILLAPYCPPYYPDMAAAVQAVVERKFGERGVFRNGSAAGAWRDPASVASRIPPASERAIAATVAYCEYIYRRYGRFPAYSAPFRTVMGFQATHVDPEFYERFYRPEALSETQRSHSHERLAR